MCSTRVFAGISAVLAILTIAPPAPAQYPVIWYTDRDEWSSHVYGGAHWTPFLPENVACADEVQTLPGNGTALGSTLTFHGVWESIGFRLRTLEPGSSFIFNDMAGGSDPLFPDSLSVGAAGQFQDDDWEFTTWGWFGDEVGCAVGFDLMNNRSNAGELVSAYWDDQPVGSIVLFRSRAKYQRL